MNIKDLPDLSEEFLLSDKQVANYQKDGHILLKEVASLAEVSSYRPFIADAVKEYKKVVLPLNERDTYGKAFLQLGNLWRLDESVRYYVMAHRFAKIAADLMGVNGVRIHFDQALFKEPDGGPTPWHQDQTYWPLDTENTITMWMPLIDVSADMGCMAFASGTHKLNDISKTGSRLTISDESEAHFQRFITDSNITQISYGAMKAGDATFHSGWTLHSASGNKTNKTREVMTIMYFADNTRLLEADSPNRQWDLDFYFPGLKPGDLAANAFNPLVYQR